MNVSTPTSYAAIENPAAYDLHTHTCHSDGALAPAAMVQRAAANGIRVLALTDHDEVSGLVEARAAAGAAGIRLIDGVEISVTWAGHTIHVLGLAIDPAHPQLAAGLATVRAGRDARAERIGAALETLGFDGALAGARRYATNPALVSRAHFARWLVERGAVKDMSAAFRRYLGQDEVAYVPQQWAALGEALAWIRASGGDAVIAHPGRYKMGTAELDALFAEFRDGGGAALEVVSGSHSDTEARTFAARARRFGLRASCGSDFHAEGESRFDAGRLPALPAECTPVWQDWRDGMRAA
ncbi:MAG: PHP domain-containing protein [Burkholderiales bacterium]